MRTPAEYASGYLDGALNLPMDRFVENYADLAPDKSINVTKLKTPAGKRLVKRKLVVS